MSAVLDHRPLKTPPMDAAIDLDEICRLFGNALEGGPVGPDADFFEIGGSSMGAISLVLDIERRTGLELSIQAVYNSPTPRGVLGLIRGDDDADNESAVIMLRRGCGRHALFLVHGVGGSAIELRELAHRFDPELDVFGIQARGFDGTPPDWTVEAMARRYADEVTRLRSTGPILLAGYSFGGLVAFEMARLLIAGGRQVGFLGLIDAYPDPGVSLPRLWLHLKLLLRVPAGTRRTTLTLRLRNVALRLAVRLGLETIRPLDRPDALPEAVRRVRLATEAAQKRYRLAAQPVDVAFFKAAQASALVASSPAPIWRKLVRDLTIDVIPGDHSALVRTSSAELAAAIARRLGPVLEAT